MKKNIVTFLLLFLYTFASFSQSDTSVVERLNKFVTNIHFFNRLYPQEKVYLHFDNTGYYLGETIWFKAYVVFANNHRPDTLRDAK